MKRCDCGKGFVVPLPGNPETDCCTCTLEKFKAIYGYEYTGKAPIPPKRNGLFLEDLKESA